MTTAQMTEIQLIFCRASAGFFVLYLDGKVSDRISFSATAGQLQAALLVR
jgi:hypothetical protein